MLITVFRDIVADRFDAGVRLGDTIDKDMIAIPIGPELRMAAVASPAYFSRYPIPQTPHELTQHCCINQRMVKSGGLYVWDFDQEGGDLDVIPGERAGDVQHIRTYCHRRPGRVRHRILPEEFGAHIEEGRLIRVLETWCQPFPGYYLAFTPAENKFLPHFHWWSMLCVFTVCASP